jgi:hypothetical protein
MKICWAISSIHTLLVPQFKLIEVYVHPITDCIMESKSFRTGRLVEI